MSKNNIDETKEPILDVFTEEEIAEFGWTPEQRKLFNRAEAISALADNLPKNKKEIELFNKQFDKEFPANMKLDDAVKKAFSELPVKNPEFAKQLFASSMVMTDTQVEEPKQVTKVSKKNINKVKADEALKNLTDKK